MAHTAACLQPTPLPSPKKGPRKPQTPPEPLGTPQHPAQSGPSRPFTPRPPLKSTRPCQCGVSWGLLLIRPDPRGLLPKGLEKGLGKQPQQALGLRRCWPTLGAQGPQWGLRGSVMVSTRTFLLPASPCRPSGCGRAALIERGLPPGAQSWVGVCVRRWVSGEGKPTRHTA